ncbi:hypothetical protein J2P12_08230, partial [Candidatus Bathyarchaeota archaeon]|nr:hypothetical protein [Candidatus Bathyarchaeota archaeon]
MRVVYLSNSGLYSTPLTGSSKGSPELIDGNASYSDSLSGVTDSAFTTHVLYASATNNDVKYAYRLPSNSQWQSSQDSPFSGSFPSITVDYASNDVYAFAIQGSSIVMRQRVPNHPWSDQSLVFPVTGRINPTLLNSNYASIGGTNSSNLEIVWTEGIGPFNIAFASIPLETVWSPYSSPADPWDGYGIAPYGQYFANLGESVSPSTGMLTVRQDLLSVTGRGLNLDFTMVYTEPYSFLNEKPFNYESYPWAPLGDGWQLNFPWLNDTASPEFIHLWNGQG